MGVRQLSNKKLKRNVSKLLFFVCLFVCLVRLKQNVVISTGRVSFVNCQTRASAKMKYDILAIGFIRYKISRRRMYTAFCFIATHALKFYEAYKLFTAAQQTEDEYVEGFVCKDSDVGENQMKQVDLEDVGKVLLIRKNGKLSALGAKCTHYGAPLHSGALGENRVRCQWHGACFNILTGDIEDFPGNYLKKKKKIKTHGTKTNICLLGFDSLPCFQVTVENEQVKVRAKRRELETSKRVKSMVKYDARDSQSIVIIGGGPSGATCAETLRQEGFTGKITLVCKENCLPYDRVKVSKTMDFEIEKAEFRTAEFYQENGIDVLRGIEATGVDTTNKTVALSNGQNITFDRLYIATGIVLCVFFFNGFYLVFFLGLRANKLNIPGAELNNVVVLRDYAHSVYTNAQLSEDKEIVVLGASFVALEAANYCLNKVKKVTVVIRDVVPFRALLGKEIGAAVMKLFQEKGIHFVIKSGLKQVLSDSDGNVTGAELISGEVLKADLVIMGVGSSCYTEFLKDSGINLLPDGAIEVDEHLESNVPGIYAGGDIAHAPVWSYDNKKATIGHYPLAQYHGRIAALNMLNKKTELRAVPYFWTMLFGKGIRYAGHGKYDDILYYGNVEQLKFIAFYLQNDRVIGASSCSMDPYVSKFAENLSEGKKLFRKDLEGDMLAWAK